MFKHLSEIRFKLLALVPVVSGFAIALVSNNVPAFQAQPTPRMLVGVLGFVVTLGITIYDQRNSQIYNMLFHYARHLEESLGLESGVCSRRPGRTLKLFGVVTIWHDRGLALIYGFVLGAWTFPIIIGVLWLVTPKADISFTRTAACVATLAAAVFTLELHRLDRSPSPNKPPEVRTLDIHPDSAQTA